MKKTIFLIAAALMLNVSIAVVPFSEVVKPLNANDIMVPVGKTGQKFPWLSFQNLNQTSTKRLLM